MNIVTRASFASTTWKVRHDILIAGQVGLFVQHSGFLSTSVLLCLEPTIIKMLLVSSQSARKCVYLS